jgi:hypothetical protein
MDCSKDTGSSIRILPSRGCGEGYQSFKDSLILTIWNFSLGGILQKFKVQVKLIRKLYINQPDHLSLFIEVPVYLSIENKIALSKIDE